MAEAESIDPDRLLTSDISKPRSSGAKKLLELARQSRVPSQSESQPVSEETPIPGKGIPKTGIPETTIPFIGIPKTSIPEKGIPVLGIVSSAPSDEPITVLNNYTKQDNDISDKLARLQSVGEQAVYNRLYRLSWGYRRRTCRIGLGSLSKSVGISRSASQRNLESLAEKGHILAYDDWNQEGRLYRVLLPCELNLDSKTLVGPPLPLEIEQEGNGIDSSVPFKGIPDLEYTQNRYTGIPESGIPILERIKEKSLLKKERNTLSAPQIIAAFYESIGQKRIAREKRERGVREYEKLLQDGFSSDDIQLSCAWAVRHVPGVHSFSIIPEIIGQALVEKEHIQKKNQQEELHHRNEEQKRQQQEEQQDQRKQAAEQRNGMSQQERQTLRQQAEARMPDDTKKMLKPESVAYAKMIDAHELDILIGQQPKSPDTHHS